jgi:hypothetical protein
LDGLTGTGWYSIAVDKDTNIWIGSNAGLNKFDGSSFSHFTAADGLPSDHVTAVLPRENGELWIGTVTGSGAAKFDGDTWEVYGTAEGLVNNNVNDIIEDSQGNLWFATYGGVSEFDGMTWTGYASDVYFGNTSIWSLLEDKMGNIWACSWNNGAYVFNGRHWSRLQQSDGLANNDIRDAAMQGDGTIWLATYGSGISSVFRETMMIDSVTSSPVICHNDSTGSIKIYARPPEVKYTINLISLSSSGIFDKLPAGNYHPAITNEFDTIFAADILFENPDPILVDLGNDTTICAGSSVTLSAPFSWWYEWSNGVSGDRQIIVSDAGTYSVIVSNEDGCKGFDTIMVAVQESPVVNLGNDTTICEGARLLLTAPPAASYEWSNNSTSQQIAVNEASTYSVTVTDNHGCEGSDDIMVAVQDLPVVDLGEDRTLNSIESITLDAGLGFASYLWSTGSTSQTLPVDGAALSGDTLFWVKVTDGYGCQGGDTILIDYVITYEITDQMNEHAVLIYPNPANNKIFIICRTDLKLDYIVLFDEAGKLVKSLAAHDHLTNYEIEITEIPAGKYILMIRSDDKIFTKAIIKK